MINKSSIDADRIVVTGTGVLLPNANCTSEFLEVLQNGRSGITKWKNFNPSLSSKIGGDLSEFDYNKYIADSKHQNLDALIPKAKKLFKISPFSGKLSFLSAMEALNSAGLCSTDFDPFRVGHIMAGHNLNSNYIFTNTKQFLSEPEYIDGLFGMVALDTDILALINNILNIKGISYLVGGACASGNLAVMAAIDSIKQQRADIILVTGPITDLDPITLQSLAIMQAISVNSFNDTPERASRPFDRLREGFVPSHGTGCIILERFSHAKKRNANIVAEIYGISATSDANRSTRPTLDGQLRAMQQALDDANINADQIKYVNAHATSSIIGDKTEIEAIKSCFTNNAYQLKINATKSITGHCIYSSGIIEIIATILELQNKFVHPTLNQEVKDEDLDLDFVPNYSQDYEFDIAMSNAFGFGGLNSSIIVGKVK